jgi:hypothetical protein
MNYALDTPTQRNLYIPKPDEQLKLKLPEHTPERDQSHRHFQWLFHRPQDSAIFPAPAESARLDKKK